MKRAAEEAVEVGEDGEYIDDQVADDDDEALIERSRQRRLQILAKYGEKQRKVAFDDTTAGEGNGERGDDHDHDDDDDGKAASLPLGERSSPPPPPQAVPTSDTDSEDDMFADTPEDKQHDKMEDAADDKTTTRENKQHEKHEKRNVVDIVDKGRRKLHAAKGLADSYDDAEGYYNFQVGEVLGSRYEVFATHGKGVFSSVLRARDLRHAKQTEPVNGLVELTDQEKDACPHVAVKIIRANETMFKAGQLEKVILSKLSHADPDGTMHCVKMLDSFEYRHHLCLVFEALDMNLRDLTKKYGRGIGLHISAVRAYATQMLIALHHLKRCGVLHADIKPDNILVNEDRTAIKLCDFGSAMFSGDNTITPYLVSRFYRAPEVILGLPYDHPMDMWSIGCVIYELFTGHILFQGRTNNDMLKAMMDVKGPFSKKMLKKAEFAFKHFDVAGTWSFLLEEQDVMTKQIVKRTIDNPRAVESLSLSKRLGLASAAPEEKRQLSQLVDLLERILALDPEKRLTPVEALQHPFIKGEDSKNDRNIAQKRPRPAFSAPRAVMRAGK